MAEILHKAEDGLKQLETDLIEEANKFFGRGSPTNTAASAKPGNRFSSFAPRTYGNQAKWYVDGCGYFWAVSEAIAAAKKSIYILDCEFLD
jgi:phospholipase D1/2